MFGLSWFSWGGVKASACPTNGRHGQRSTVPLPVPPVPPRNWEGQRPGPTNLYGNKTPRRRVSAGGAKEEERRLGIFSPDYMFLICRACKTVQPGGAGYLFRAGSRSAVPIDESLFRFFFAAAGRAVPVLPAATVLRTVLGRISTSTRRFCALPSGGPLLAVRRCAA